MDWRPTEDKILSNTETISSFVDNFSNAGWARYNILTILGAIKFNFVPWSLGGHFNTFLEFFWGIHYRVVDPFLVLDLMMVSSD